MTTLRSVLLTLALFALLVATALVRHAVAAPSVAAASSGAPADSVMHNVTHAAYFNTRAPSQSPQLGLLPSAAVNRAFARQAETLRMERGLASTDPLSSATIFPTHAANRAISLEEARVQAPRVAAARSLSTATVLALVDQYTERFAFGGDAQVNLRMLNIALDELR